MNSSSMVAGCFRSCSGVRGRWVRGGRFEGVIHKVMIPYAVVLDAPFPFDLDRGPMKEPVSGYRGRWWILGRGKLWLRLSVSGGDLTGHLGVCGPVGGGG